MKIVSIHVPRTAGSSLWGQFSNAFGNEFLADYDHDPLSDWPAQIRAPWPEGKRVIHGHFRPERYLNSITYLITFLRHPVPLVTALYCAWKRIRPMHATHSRFWRERPELITFASWRPIRSLMSETYFGGFDMSRFNFIGTYEDRKEDLARLGKTLGIKLSEDWHDNRLEKRDEREKLEADSMVQESLRKILANDVRFYLRNIET